MPLLNFNTKQNIYIQVYIFVQVPCTILSELSKNASSNQSFFVWLFFSVFYNRVSPPFRLLLEMINFLSLQYPYLPVTALEKNKKPQTQKQPAGTSVTHTHKSPISQAFKQEGGCRITSAKLIFGGLFMSSLKQILP